MLCLLGGAGWVQDGGFTPLLLRPKALALLAYLALAGRAVGRHELAGLLFPDAEEPRAALRWHLNHLHTAAPEHIAGGLRATRASVALAITTEVALFREGANRLLADPTVADATDVLALYRGDLLSGLDVSASAAFDTWLYVEQEGLRRRFRQAAVAFARWALGNGRAREVVEPISRLVSVEPYCEDGHLLLLEAYERLGEPDRAAAAYDRYQRIMRRELHLEPRRAIARRFEPDPPDGRTAPYEDLVPLRDVTIHIVDWPGGEPTVLGIHGSGGSAHGLGALAEQLAPGQRFVALDLRGHGFSDKPPSGYDLADHIGDIVQLTQALGLHRPVLLGHSAGGTVAAFAAAQADIGGLILLEGMIGDRAFTENAAAQMAPVVRDLHRRFAGFDDYLAEWRSGRSPWGDEAERLLDRWAHYELARLPDGSYRRRALQTAVEAEWASIIQADSLAALARVVCPVMIVQALQPFIGGRPYFTDGIVAAQLRAAPAATLFVARDSHHGTIIRDPEPEMIGAIRWFIQQEVRLDRPIPHGDTTARESTPRPRHRSRP